MKIIPGQVSSQGFRKRQAKRELVGVSRKKCVAGDRRGLGT